jgi:hypothetical protein
MHKSRLGALVVDCQTNDLPAEAAFWAGALGADPESGDRQTDARYLRLNGKPSEAQMLLQKVEHPSRVHLDIETDDIEAEVKRLEALGASVVERLPKWVVMEAPSRHRFCVISPIRTDFEDNANVWE